MYRIGDKVKVINACYYHSWSVDTIAKVYYVGDNSLGLTNEAGIDQELYIEDVEFVSRTEYIVGDRVMVIGRSYGHDIPIGSIVSVERVRYGERHKVIDVVYESTNHHQGVAPESLAPISFTASQGFAGFVSASTALPADSATITTDNVVESFEELAEQLYGIRTNYNSNRYIPSYTRSINPIEYARAVSNDVVKVNVITDRPRCEDDSLFTEFTSWQHSVTERVREASDGLVIDKHTVITFLGTNSERDDIFSIRYADTGNIVIAKGKLNNGYAKYIS
jgi:hypothetical protein